MGEKSRFVERLGATAKKNKKRMGGSASHLNSKKKKDQRWISLRGNLPRGGGKNRFNYPETVKRQNGEGEGGKDECWRIGQGEGGGPALHGKTNHQ